MGRASSSRPSYDRPIGPRSAVAGAALTYPQLADAAGGLARRLEGARRVALYATPTLDTVVAVVGALAAGVPIVAISPHSGQRELEHIVGDSEPEAVLAAAETELPPTLPGAAARIAGRRRRTVPRPGRGRPRGGRRWSSTPPARPGCPKGVEIPRRAIATNLDALADAWAWTGEDVLVARPAALPRPRARARHPRAAAARRAASCHVGALRRRGARRRRCGDGATMLFGVPTMYHRLADAAERDPRRRRRAAPARGCSCPARRRCPAVEHDADRAASPGSGSSSATG